MLTQAFCRAAQGRGLHRRKWNPYDDRIHRERRGEEGEGEVSSLVQWSRLLHTNPSPSQITRKIKRVLQKAVVDHSVAERKAWAKFGQEKGNKPGPDRATTTVGENVSLKLSPGNKVSLVLLHETHNLILILREGGCARTVSRTGGQGEPCESRRREGCLSVV